jgi:predicted RNase H-like HicB family nuclease
MGHMFAIFLDVAAGETKDEVLSLIREAIELHVKG